jgi:hypothetical protein
MSRAMTFDERGENHRDEDDVREEDINDPAIHHTHPRRRVRPGCYQLLLEAE